jgi:(p)ppGpp synthase/HD superfamily hydrolase
VESGKGEAQEQYINHLLEVANLVAQATHGEEPEVVTAALLHDVEDQAVPIELIAREFGARVADIVRQLTDDKTLSKDARKRSGPKRQR